MWSKDIIVANITLMNSSFWHLHPYDCTNVTVSNVTILSPVSGAPNTDGIDPGILATPVFNSIPVRLSNFKHFDTVPSI